MAELIAAIATPLAPSGVGVVRLSGPGALETAGRVFSPRRGGSLAQCPPRQMVLGDLHDEGGRLIDQGLAFYTPAPHSYTGEEGAELHCHGSPVALTLVLEALIAAGARLAGPGEFTRRAFVNGKLDLVQAEAVMDLIDAETPAAARHAAGHLAGALSQRVEGIYQGLTDLLAHFHAVLDYPDEDIDPFREELIGETLTGSLAALDALAATYQRGRQLTQGVPCAIVGRPNAGKSTLLNALVGYERAIVTPLPGTTRDTVEERCTLGGVLLRLIDTAGLRETADPVERLGVARSRAAMEGAGLILLLLDSTQPATAEDAALLQQARTLAPTILLWTKADLREHPLPQPALPGELPPTVTLSAKTGKGLDALAQAVAALFPQGGGRDGGELLTNARQYDAACRAQSALRAAQGSLGAGFPPDLVLSDVEEALTALGELTGRSVREDVTARIFARFCVGK